MLSLHASFIRAMPNHQGFSPTSDAIAEAPAAANIADPTVSRRARRAARYRDRSCRLLSAWAAAVPKLCRISRFRPTVTSALAPRSASPVRHAQSHARAGGVHAWFAPGGDLTSRHDRSFNLRTDRDKCRRRHRDGVFVVISNYGARHDRFVTDSYRHMLMLVSSSPQPSAQTRRRCQPRRCWLLQRRFQYFWSDIGS